MNNIFSASQSNPGTALLLNEENHVGTHSGLRKNCR